MVYKKTSQQYPLVFSTWFNLEQEVEHLFQYLKSQGVRRLVIAFDNDPFFQAINNVAVGQAKQLGMEIVSHEAFTVGEQDFRTYLTKLRGKKPDGITFGFADEGSLMAFLKQRKELLPEVRLFGTDYVDGFVGLDNFRGLFEKTFFVSPQAKDVSFKHKYRAKFGSDPVLSASTAYDAANLLYQALLGSGEDVTAVAKFLSSKNHQTVTFGEVSFDNFEGVGKSNFAIKEVRNDIAQ